MSKIVAANYHTCALLTNGGVKCWGYNNHGQRGNGTLTNRLTAVGVMGNRRSNLRYMPWGENRYIGFPESSMLTDYRYTGQRKDSYINLYWYNSRWYDPYLNRWTSPDPIIPDPSNPLDWDRYSYCRNNPVNSVDPSGHSPNVVMHDSNAGDPKRPALDLAEKYRKKAFAGTIISWDGLSEVERAILAAGGWDEDSYTAHINERGVSQAQGIYDPLNWGLVYFGGKRLINIVKPVIKPVLGIITSAIAGAAEVVSSVNSTGRSGPLNLKEQLAMKVAMADPAIGRVLPINLGDPRWPASEGWVKMQQNINGVIIHYVYNIITGVAADFKFP